jgi:hypothetical protein
MEVGLVALFAISYINILFTESATTTSANGIFLSHQINISNNFFFLTTNHNQSPETSHPNRTKKTKPVGVRPPHGFN